MTITVRLSLLAHLALGASFVLAAGLAQTSKPTHQAAPVSAVSMSSLPITSRGSDKAPITILVFSDFESFPCARSASVIDGFLKQTRDVRVIFKHAPAASNPNALLAHEAALAAGAQGKFWEMHDTLFENQTHLTRADLLGYAKSLGLDLAAFERALWRFSRNRSPFSAEPDHHSPVVDQRDRSEATLAFRLCPRVIGNARELIPSGAKRRHGGHEQEMGRGERDGSPVPRPALQRPGARL
jgi:hypothetical protein